MSTEPLDPVLVDLMSPRREVRKDALSRLVISRPALYALRRIALEDEDATLRLSAIEILEASKDPIAGPWLEEAIDDPRPTVREAAHRALGRFDARPGVIAKLRRASREDPEWRPRRAAVRALARLLGRSAVMDLRACLDDPFWRVRHAAVSLLLRLGEDAPAERDAILRPEQEPARAAAALAYLAGRWGVAHEAIAHRSTQERGLDPDPAVAAAALERSDFHVSPATLVECLADPHAPLRQSAAKRLERTDDLRPLALALLWLEEPRIPHAAETVRALFDRLEGRAQAIAHATLAALRADRPRATAWAIAFLARSSDPETREHAQRGAESPHPLVRCSAIEALATLRPRTAEDLARLADALFDPDDRVRTRAAWALFESNDDRALDRLAALDLDDAPIGVRRAIVEAAAKMDRFPTLEAALRGEDAWTKARAVFFLSRRGRLSNARRQVLARHDDPWIRTAVLDPQTALEALRSDPDPDVRREAFRIAPATASAAEAACVSGDPYLRAESAARFDASTDEGFDALLLLTRDRALVVRSAAAGVLEALEDLDARLDARLFGPRSADDGEIRAAAYTWCLRRFDVADEARLARALEDPSEPEVVKTHLRAMAIAFGPPIEAPKAEKAKRAKLARPRAAVARRPFGKTGLVCAPIAISGAFDLSPGALVQAYEAGVDLFFWEPTYTRMTRFLRASSARRQNLAIIAGSYHASPRAIEKDVDRALRRLRTDAIDVFLLFWARSSARVSREAYEALAKIRAKGKIRAAGFSTHDRDLAADAIAELPFDVVMIRHSAAHPRAEERLFPLALAKGTAVLTFSALCCGRLLERSRVAPDVSAPTAADCYRYSINRPGVSACISAPRHHKELVENLAVLEAPMLPETRAAAIAAHGARIREENVRFNELIRRGDAHALELALRLEEESDTMRAVPESCRS
jgi:aryl-alcohol dehydrogenase-like predicted oxidoreductase/HEAT repeat protein